MTDAERIEKLEFEIAALYRLIKHIACGGCVQIGTDGRLEPSPFVTSGHLERRILVSSPRS